MPGIVERDLLDECHQRFLDIVEGRIPKGGMTVMRDISLKDTAGLSRERIVNKVQDLVWDDVFAKYIGHPKLLDYVENFVGPNITAMHTMLINKPPDSGKLTSRHPCHQVVFRT